MTLFTDKAAQYMPRLMADLGITKVQAAGIFGNIGGETGGFLSLQEIKPTVQGSRGGYGWLQWTGPRRKKYEAWCEANHMAPASDEANYKYLVYETRTAEAHSLEQLRKTSTIEAATETFMAQNLRPGVKNLQSRINWGKKAFEAYQDQKASDAKVGTAGAVIVGGAVATAAAPQHVWAWIIGSTVAIALVAWWIIHEYHKQEKQEVLTKGNTNGKEKGRSRS